MRTQPAVPLFCHAICLLFAFIIGCSNPAANRGTATVRLDRALAVEVTQPSIELTVIDQDPNLIWSLIKMAPDYTGMNELVEKFLLAADSSAVAHTALDPWGQTELGEFPAGKYWVVTRGLVTAGRERLLWSLPIVVDASDIRKKNLFLHRSNAALVLEPGNTPL